MSVARAAGARTFPARFLFVAAMNPCPCGYRGDPRRACACSPRDVARYRRKISGPLLDRIDLHVEVPAVASSDFGSEGDGEPSAAVRARVVAAREVQRARSGDPRLVNAALSGRSGRSALRPTPEAKALLDRAVDRLTLSARGYQRVLRVARTIADLAGRASVGTAEVAEALRFRPGREPHETA